MSEKVLYVIGVVDYAGAVHARKVSLDDASTRTHGFFWPGVTHKLWRFHVPDWQMDTSVHNKTNLTEEDWEAVERAVEKLVKPPEWVLQGRAWDAAGRPRGTKYDKFLKNFKKSLDGSTNMR